MTITGLARPIACANLANLMLARGRGPITMGAMPLRTTALPLALLLPQANAQPALPEILSRVAEEAGVLQQNAPKMPTQETLEQRAAMPPSRFRPLIGGAAESPQPRRQFRQVVSEYSVGTLEDSGSRNLIEFRQVITVDVRPIQSAERARHALSLGVHSPDERIRKRMLGDFAGHGLVDVASDYALILLAFSKRGLEQMKISPGGVARRALRVTSGFASPTVSRCASRLGRSMRTPGTRFATRPPWITFCLRTGS